MLRIEFAIFTIDIDDVRIEISQGRFEPLTQQRELIEIGMNGE